MGRPMDGRTDGDRDMRMQLDPFASNLDPTNDPVKKTPHFFNIRRAGDRTDDG